MFLQNVLIVHCVSKKTQPKTADFAPGSPGYAPGKVDESYASVLILVHLLYYVKTWSSTKPEGHIVLHSGQWRTALRLQCIGNLYYGYSSVNTTKNKRAKMTCKIMQTVVCSEIRPVIPLQTLVDSESRLYYRDEQNDAVLCGTRHVGQLNFHSLLTISIA